LLLKADSTESGLHGRSVRRLLLSHVRRLRRLRWRTSPGTGDDDHVKHHRVVKVWKPGKQVAPWQQGGEHLT